MASDEDEDDFDDYPSTHLDDEAYDEFLRRETDAGGRLREVPPITWWILLAILAVLAVAIVTLRG